MSQDTRERLSGIREQKRDLEEQKRKLREPIEDLLSDTSIDRSQEEWYRSYLARASAIDSQFSTILEEEENCILDLISEQAEETTKAIEELRHATEALNSSSREEIAATQQLEVSSQRLNLLTDALLLLTGVLAVAGVGTYALDLAKENGLSGGFATWLTILIVLITVGVIFVGFYILTKRRRAFIRSGSQMT